MNIADELNEIWKGDLLDRQKEAHSIQAFIERECDFLSSIENPSSLVLAIDAPYGRGKTWFIERLAKQLELSHPVARIDAWADDAADEPLTAFMAAIDTALLPYISTSRKLSDRLAAAKASALPIIGKLISGVGVKALSKIAGDQIEDDLGDIVENAVRGAKSSHSKKEDGLAADVLQEAFNKLDTEIDSLVDRRGAAMLAAYSQRKLSRDVFRLNMHQLVASINQSETSKNSPLIIVIDELDRCRPNYALKILEEIKHFFNIPQICFIICLHRLQLSKSVNAVYGPNFDSDDYLRRFFNRRYELKDNSISLFTESVILNSKFDLGNIRFPKVLKPNGDPQNSTIISLLLQDWGLTAREADATIDGLRIFISGWNHKIPIDGLVALSIIVNNIKGQPLNYLISRETGAVTFEGLSWVSQNGANPQSYTAANYLHCVAQNESKSIIKIIEERRGTDAAKNYFLSVIDDEMRSRNSSNSLQKDSRSYIWEYRDRVRDLARFERD